MTEEQIALAHRAVACKGWRWMPGMLVVGSTRFGEWPFRICDPSRMNLRDNPGAMPDLSDAATIGCVVAVVREAWRDARICTSYDHVDEKWYCDGPHEYEGKMMIGVFADGSTEMEALVAALEAAP